MKRCSQRLAARRRWRVEALEALGIVESFSVTSLIEGADAAVKTANVQLIEIRLAMALGGECVSDDDGRRGGGAERGGRGGAGSGAKGHAGEQSGDPAPASGTVE